MPKFLILLLFSVFYLNLNAQTKTKFCEQVQAINTLVKKEHYSPKPINDSLSKGVHSLFLKALDPDTEFFLKSDIKLFELDTFILDDYILDQDCSFIDSYVTIFNKRIEEAKKHIQLLENQELDYSGKDSLHFDYQRKLNYFENEEAAKAYWNKRIRYKIIRKSFEEDSALNAIKVNFKTIEANYKSKVIQNQLCLLEEMLSKNGGIENFVKEAFLNAMLTYQDPNSFFFNNSEKQVFESSLSSSELSFGVITDKNNEGEIVIVYITPGSTAEKNGILEESDVIISLSSEDDLLEAYCVSNADILSYLSDESHHKVTFKIRKTDGSIRNIELTKGIVNVESNKTDSFILDGTKKLGYIKILSFYTGVDSFGGNGLSRDVAKELFKLLKAKVDGLIIDLRFNGGGSMREATELLGMFINRGPVSIVRYNTGETITIRDPKRGVIFNKPVVILVNQYSASATEYFAGTMQDYNRALLVGTPTHGKATAQIILPLDEKRDLGFGKLTVEKFYRITGESHQTVGVRPDIELPTLYSSIEIGERYEPYVLNNDTLDVSLKYNKLNDINLKALTTNSYKRINSSKTFKKIKDLNHNLVSNYVRKKKNYPLTVEAIHQDIDNYFKIWDDFNSLFEGSNKSYGVHSFKETESNDVLTNEILGDMYVEEAYNIMLDLLDMIAMD